MFNPDVIKGDWTAQEDMILVRLHKEKGSRWTEFVQSLPGRTDNAIKNRFNSAKRRVLRYMSTKSNSRTNVRQEDVLFHYCQKLINQGDEPGEDGDSNDFQSVPDQNDHDSRVSQNRSGSASSEHFLPGALPREEDAIQFNSSLGGYNHYPTGLNQLHAHGMPHGMHPHQSLHYHSQVAANQHFSHQAAQAQAQLQGPGEIHSKLPHTPFPLSQHPQHFLHHQLQLHNQNQNQNQHQHQIGNLPQHQYHLPHHQLLSQPVQNYSTFNSAALGHITRGLGAGTGGMVSDYLFHSTQGQFSPNSLNPPTPAHIAQAQQQVQHAQAQANAQMQAQMQAQVLAQAHAQAQAQVQAQAQAQQAQQVQSQSHSIGTPQSQFSPSTRPAHSRSPSSGASLLSPLSHYTLSMQGGYTPHGLSYPPHGQNSQGHGISHSTESSTQAQRALSASVAPNSSPSETNTTTRAAPNSGSISGNVSELNDAYPQHRQQHHTHGHSHTLSHLQHGHSHPPSMVFRDDTKSPPALDQHQPPHLGPSQSQSQSGMGALGSMSAQASSPWSALRPIDMNSGDPTSSRNGQFNLYSSGLTGIDGLASGIPNSGSNPGQSSAGIGFGENSGLTASSAATFGTFSSTASTLAERSIGGTANGNSASVLSSRGSSSTTSSASSATSGNMGSGSGNNSTVSTNLFFSNLTPSSISSLVSTHSPNAQSSLLTHQGGTNVNNSLGLGTLSAVNASGLPPTSNNASNNGSNNTSMGALMGMNGFNGMSGMGLGPIGLINSLGLSSSNTAAGYHAYPMSPSSALAGMGNTSGSGTTGTASSLLKSSAAASPIPISTSSNLHTSGLGAGSGSNGALSSSNDNVPTVASSPLADRSSMPNFLPSSSSNGGNGVSNGNTNANATTSTPISAVSAALGTSSGQASTQYGGSLGILNPKGSLTNTSIPTSGSNSTNGLSMSLSSSGNDTNTPMNIKRMKTLHHRQPSGTGSLSSLNASTLGSDDGTQLTSGLSSLGDTSLPNTMSGLSGLGGMSLGLNSQMHSFSGMGFGMNMGMSASTFSSLMAGVPGISGTNMTNMAMNAANVLGKRQFHNPSSSMGLSLGGLLLPYNTSAAGNTGENPSTNASSSELADS